MTLTADLNSVRYIKNGPGGQWWAAAKAGNELHIGWGSVPIELLVNGDMPAARQTIAGYTSSTQVATMDANALESLMIKPSQHIWVTIQDGYLWWCTVHDGLVANPAGVSAERGHAWLVCDLPWSNRSIGGRLLSVADLPGTVTMLAGFRATTCKPRATPTILSILRDEVDPDAQAAAQARGQYELAVEKTIQRLSPFDFEQLIDLIMVRSGWARISTLGKTREGVDLEVENLAAGEIAFVQVKSSATQAVLDDYVGRFLERREQYHRMIFTVHTPVGELEPPKDLPVQIWTGPLLSRLVIRSGLGQWVESRLA